MNSKKSFDIRLVSYKDILIFLIPAVVFFQYLRIYNPGILSYDSYNQLNQIYTHDFNSWHPFFHTFVEMLCLKVYNSPMAVGAFQILVFSTLWTVICRYSRSDNKKFDMQFLFQLLITLVMSLIPINAIYSITLWKDILYSYFLMFMCFVIKIMIDKETDLRLSRIIIVTLTMSFVWHFRQNGKYVVLIMLLILVIYFLKRNQKRQMVLLALLTFAFSLLISSLSLIYNVKKIEKDPLMTKEAHMLAHYYLNVDVTSKDADTITMLVSEESIINDYNLFFSDPIYTHTNQEVYKQNKGKYMGLAIKYSLKNPIVAVKYVFGSSAIVWDIVRKDYWVGSPYYTDINAVNNTTNITAVNLYEEDYMKLNRFVNLAKDNRKLDTLFNSPALYMYLAFIAIIFIRVKTKSKKIYLFYLPNMLNILLVMFSTPLQDNRYLYGNQLTFYVLMIMIVGIIFPIQKKQND